MSDDYQDDGVSEPPFRKWAAEIVEKLYDQHVTKLEAKMRASFDIGKRRTKKAILANPAVPALVRDPETNRYSVVLDGVEVYRDLDPFGKRAAVREAAAGAAPPDQGPMSAGAVAVVVLPGVPGTMLPMTTKVHRE